MLPAVAISIFVLTLVILNLLFYALTYRKRTINTRFKSVLGKSERSIVKPQIRLANQTSRRFLKYFSLPGSFVIGKKYSERLQMELLRAGLPLKVEEMLGINISLIILMALVGGLLTGKLLVTAVFGLMGLIIPVLFLKLIKHRRLAKVEGQLLDATIILANSLRAGHSFIQALSLVSKETPAPLSVELEKVIKESKVGISIEDALNNLVNRIQSGDLEMVVTGVLIQRQVGGNLAEILDTIAETIDKRIKTRAKIRALTAQGRLSAVIVTLLPFTLAAFIYTANPEFGKIMIEESIGRIMIASGMVLMVLGVIVIRKVVNIDL